MHAQCVERESHCMKPLQNPFSKLQIKTNMSQLYLCVAEGPLWTERLERSRNMYSFYSVVLLVNNVWTLKAGCQAYIFIVFGLVVDNRAFGKCGTVLVIMDSNGEKFSQSIKVFKYNLNG